MKNKIAFPVFLILLVVFMGCNKNKTSETPPCIDPQVPGEYFPAFPNSYWNFINSKNESVKYQISANYQDCYGKCRPFFLNANQCIQGTNIVHAFYCGLGQMCSILSPIYSTKIDSVLKCSFSFSNLNIVSYTDDPRYRRKTVSIDSTLEVLGKSFQMVLIIKETDVYNPNHRYFDYFAKNIGLIKRDSIDITDTTNLITILAIKNYKIGN